MSKGHREFGFATGWGLPRGPEEAAGLSSQLLGEIFRK